MSKRVPPQVRRYTKNDREGYRRETSNAAELELAKLVAESLLHADGQQSCHGSLYRKVKEPQHNERNRQRKQQQTRKVVAQRPVPNAANDVREVWRHAANQEGRP